MNPMEPTRRRKTSSGDKFSFPSITPNPPTQDSDQFEFGCITPGSPNSPADHLFSNGRLLPHPFPVSLQPQANLPPFTRSTSRASSKDSLMSSRCNSTSSRSSNSSGSCSTSTTTSARTSISTEASEKKIAVPFDQVKFGGKMGGKSGQGGLGKKQVIYVNGSTSRRWGLIPPAPVVAASHHQVGRRRKGGEIVVKKKVKVRRGGRMWFGRRFLRWFVTACKECHAIKPLRGADVNMELQ